MKVIRGVLGVVAALIVWELILRQAVIVNPGSYDHPVLGRIQRPGWTLSSREGFATTYINALGMRSPELAEKVAGEVRILVIGDSLTTGFEVADGATYCDRLQAMLTAQLKRPVTVVNAGRAGASPAFYLQLADVYQRAVAPDYTVIQLDESDFSDEAFVDVKSFRFVAAPDGFRLVAASPEPAPEPPLKRLAALHPALQPLGTLQGGLRSSITTAVDKLRPQQEAIAARLRSAGPFAATGTPPAHDYTGLLRWSVPRLLKRYPGAVVLFVPDESAGRTRVERLVAETVQASGGICLNPRRAFSQAAQSHRPPRGFNNTMPGTGHLNELGHQLVADHLAAHFAARLTP